MTSLDRLREQLRQRSTSAVALAAEMDRSTVRRIRDGSVSPRMETFEKLLTAVRTVKTKAA